MFLGVVYILLDLALDIRFRLDILLDIRLANTQEDHK